VVKPTGKLIRAAFFVEGTSGKVIHTAGLLDDKVVLNSQEGGARVRFLEELSVWFWNRGVSTAIRGLDRSGLERLAGEGKTRYGLDGEFSRYFDLGA
jgi:murein DD-endopeptidase